MTTKTQTHTPPGHYREVIDALSKPLTIDQIDFRIQSINKGGYATILPYKDARVDMNRLDDVMGVDWTNKYELIDGQLFCHIGINFAGEWIYRSDVGVESNTEATKGRASDAFKRAGFRWGIGRELYDYPLIQVKLNQDEFEVSGGKAKATWGLKLRDWTWGAKFDDDGKILQLAGKDQNENLRFNWKR